jgi:ATP-independent RNA helicase DbpA
VSPAGKVPALIHLLTDAALESVLVFSRTKHGADRIARKLNAAGLSTATLHSNRTQGQRLAALKRFRSGDVRVLIATDIAARGIDVENLSHVINFEISNIPETYVHRIGRTGRAGADGLALSLCTPREVARASAIEERQGAPLQWYKATPLSGKANNVPPAAMTTLRIDAGRSDKLRPGDILGALTGEAGLKADAIGKIDVFPTRAYVAVARGQAAHALTRLREGKIKGRKFRVSRL